MKGWIGLVGWPTADVWPTKWSSVQLAVRRSPTHDQRHWCSEAGKVTVGPASHWPCVTDSVVYGLNGLGKGQCAWYLTTHWLICAEWRKLKISTLKVSRNFTSLPVTEMAAHFLFASQLLSWTGTSVVSMSDSVVPLATTALLHGAAAAELHATAPFHCAADLWTVVASPDDWLR